MAIYTEHLIYFGQPTSDAPRPKPAPWRTPAMITDGANISSMASVAAAVNPIIRTSSMFGLFFGITHAAIATTKPSIRYLHNRVVSSLVLIIYTILKEKNSA